MSMWLCNMMNWVKQTLVSSDGLRAQDWGLDGGQVGDLVTLRAGKIGKVDEGSRQRAQRQHPRRGSKLR